MIKNTLIFALFAVTFAVLNSTITLAKDKDLPKVGANLKSYDAPTSKRCDFTVPSKKYTTIQSAIDAANTGDTVCVKQGTFIEDLVISKPIRLSGFTDFKKYLKDSDTKKATKLIGVVGGNSSTVWIKSPEVILEGFVIEGTGPNYSHTAVLLDENVKDTKVQYNYVTAGDGGLSLLTYGWQQNNTFKHNFFKGVNSPQVAVVTGTPSSGKESTNVNFYNNTFVGTVKPTLAQDTGVAFLNQSINSEVKRNSFKVNGDVTEYILTAYTDGLFTENNVHSNVVSRFRAGGSDVLLNAENNWWGSTDPVGHVLGPVDFEPFSYSAFSEY